MFYNIPKSTCFIISPFLNVIFYLKRILKLHPYWAPNPNIGTHCYKPFKSNTVQVRGTSFVYFQT